MGCDIHFNVERYTDGRWIKIPDPIRKCWCCDGTGKDPHHLTNEEDCRFCKGQGQLRKEFYNSQSYTLFSILAGVRNYSGITPISEPRGLPKDVSPEVKERYEFWIPDGHSHSWFLLSELLAFDWQQVIKHKAFVDSKTYQEWIAKSERGEPEQYGDEFEVNYNFGIIISNEEMELRLKDGTAFEGKPSHYPANKPYYTQVEWVGETYAEAAYCFFTETLPELSTLGDPSQIRIVFWFDN